MHMKLQENNKFKRSLIRYSNPYGTKIRLIDKINYLLN